VILHLHSIVSNKVPLVVSDLSARTDVEHDTKRRKGLCNVVSFGRAGTKTIPGTAKGVNLDQRCFQFDLSVPRRTVKWSFIGPHCIIGHTATESERDVASIGACQSSD
jgi:hypothetical protein